MQIGIVSDTHDNIPKAIEALDFFLVKNISIIFHSGDWVLPSTFRCIAIEAHKRGQKIYGVLGNNDLKHKEAIYKINAELYMPIKLPNFNNDFMLFKYKKRQFGIYHGHCKSRLDEIITSHTLEAIFVGHTHTPKEEFMNNTKIMNPGALSYSIPFKKRNNEIFTVGIYDLAKKRFKVYEI